jgi:murein L,D-transpeptidase YcbB/YkuD
VTTAQGVAQRLKHLGLVFEGDLRETAVAEGLRAFQRREGIAPSGVIDDATRDALLRVHGS